LFSSLFFPNHKTCLQLIENTKCFDHFVLYVVVHDHDWDGDDIDENTIATFRDVSITINKVNNVLIFYYYFEM